ncbi:MAG: radical SAM protein [Atopobiaceae bacterium]|nr:radical SAM protein [Atopobiaceae bacterium]
MKLRIHTIREDTRSEGPGHRFCVWTQGCLRRCSGCFARDTWDPQGGRELTLEDLCSLLSDRLERPPTLEGITLLGGEPFLQAAALSRFAAFAREQGLSVFCFTGFTLEELRASDDASALDLLSMVDVLADGPYLKSQRDFGRPWVGSRNQRFHFLTNRYAPDDFLGHRNRVEIRLRRDGSVALNGMADFFDLEVHETNAATQASNNDQ